MNYRRLRLLNRRFLGWVKNFNKRQRFIVGVLLLSLGFFISEYVLGKSGLFVVIVLSVLTDVFLYLALYQDLEENFYPQIFILPFFYSLSFGLFYALVPARFLTRIVMTTLYGIGLYSLFLSKNIFTVSSIRTIALLSSARTVAFALTLLSYFFLANVVFSLHTNVVVTLFLIAAFTIPIVNSTVWMSTLERDLKTNMVWTGALSGLILECAIVLWFWPSSPTLLALFLTGIFYTLTGLSQAWFEKRLFRGVILEYFWVSIVTFIVLIFFTIWF